MGRGVEERVATQSLPLIVVCFWQRWRYFRRWASEVEVFPSISPFRRMAAAFPAYSCPHTVHGYGCWPVVSRVMSVRAFHSARRTYNTLPASCRKLLARCSLYTVLLPPRCFIRQNRTYSYVFASDSARQSQDYRWMPPLTSAWPSPQHAQTY